MANKLVKRKNAGKKGNAQLRPRKEQDEMVYALTDVKETVVTENFYQSIPLSILKHYLPSVMVAE